ncbi:leucyl aminopeptidase [Pseudoroseicyclus tamaricis]|uniref:Probable cytosol aminopeptidase n=1 Tax=Pseudoroseicyclus tamaricis TaxID=2705421 RepID=A0A6B2K1K5_9RHOB|nr:leucyl aminopeptidase [Pseudoroseicyclus tamaricis]NDV01622.1 leucyl aminopeptidase [Pseudoroseicyclus tamaricis]
MTAPVPVTFAETDAAALLEREGTVAVILGPEGEMDAATGQVNSAAGEALARLARSARWGKLGEGELVELAMPAGLAAERLCAVKLGEGADMAAARKAGAAIAAAAGEGRVTIAAACFARTAELAFGYALRAYDFRDFRSGEAPAAPQVEVMCDDPEAVAEASGPMAALAEGVFFTRDLVNTPANVLTTDDFAARLAAMQEIGLEVEILEEEELAKLGLRLLLSVGQGSDSPSKVVVMRWQGGGEEAPLALVGKGVVFDTGGISLKPGAGMEDMVMDMGGAGTVAGVMRALALRRAKANVVGLVGLVENMPSGSATRPGDVVRSMKGDTVENINTDAEGRLVLADVLWYAQERFKPAAIVDLATLTGAIIVALGHDHAGVFGNDDAFTGRFMKAAEAEGEGAWHMPLTPAYDKLLKSRVADLKNVGGRPGGAVIAARFLNNFVGEGVPWIHLDIAGTAWSKSGTELAPKGATGWGVLALDRLVRDDFEA